MNSTLSNPIENLAQRVRQWRVSQNLTQTEAAQQLGIDRSYYSQVERGRVPGNALRTRFLLIEKMSSIKIKESTGRAYGLRNLPVLSWGQAAQTTDLSEMPKDWNEVVPSDVPDERSFGVRLRGDSMEPQFSDGDIAILLPGAAPANGETVLVNLKDEGVLCKIMQVQLDRNLIELSSYNPAYPPMERRRDQFHWIFPVAYILRQLR